MNSTTAPLPTRILPADATLPEGEALMKRCLQCFGLAVLLAMFSLYIPGLPPKILFFGCAISAAAVWRSWLDRTLWPLLALCAYTVATGALYSRSQPGKLDALENPGYQLLGVLLVWGCLRGRGPTGALVLIFASLGVSLVGVLGELAGLDMTSYLPIPVPNEGFFDAITTTASGASRLRGFFAESGVLGASTVSFAFIATAACLILARRKESSTAYLAAFAGGALLLFFLQVTLAKTGMLMVMLGLFGFATVNILLGSWFVRVRTIATMGVVMVMAVFLFLSPTPLGAYLREQAEDIPTPHSVAVQGREKGGTATRLTSWHLALVNLKAHPFGVGHWGLGTTISAATGISPTPEMLFWFNRDVFSLKNAMANIMAETGLVGLGLLAFWLYANLVQPALHWGKRATESSLAVAGLYGACLFIPLGLMVSCELYPYLAFTLLLKMVADAVARAVLQAEPLTQP